MPSLFSYARSTFLIKRKEMFQTQNLTCAFRIEAIGIKFRQRTQCCFHLIFSVKVNVWCMRLSLSYLLSCPSTGGSTTWGLDFFPAVDCSAPNVARLPSVDLRKHADGKLAYAICTCAKFCLYLADLEAEILQTLTDTDPVWLLLVQCRDWRHRQSAHGASKVLQKQNI